MRIFGKSLFLALFMILSFNGQAQFYSLPSHDSSTCRGWVICPLCSGKGATWWGYSGWRQCMCCGGTGKSKCPSCAGEEMAKQFQEKYEQEQWNTGWKACVQGRDFMKSGQYINAQRWLKRAYELGENNACLLLGCIYELGMGCSQNGDEAIRWYTRGNCTSELKRISSSGFMKPTDENRDKIRKAMRDWDNKVAVDTYNFVNSLDSSSPSTIVTPKGSTSSRTCNVCYGTGKCSTCRGGVCDNTYTGGTFRCPNCTSNPGVCSYCRGTGKR